MRLGPGRRQRQAAVRGPLQTSMVRMGPAYGLTTSDLLKTCKGVHFGLSVQTAIASLCFKHQLVWRWDADSSLVELYS